MGGLLSKFRKSGRGDAQQQAQVKEDIPEHGEPSRPAGTEDSQLPAQAQDEHQSSLYVIQPIGQLQPEPESPLEYPSSESVTASPSHQATLSREHKSEPHLLDDYGDDHGPPYKTDTLRSTKSEGGKRGAVKKTLSKSRSTSKSGSGNLKGDGKGGTMGKGGTLRGLFKGKSATLKSTKSSSDSLDRRSRTRESTPEESAGNFFTRLFRKSTRGKKKKKVRDTRRARSEEKAELLGTETTTTGGDQPKAVPSPGKGRVDDGSQEIVLFNAADTSIEYEPEPATNEEECEEPHLELEGDILMREDSTDRMPSETPLLDTLQYDAIAQSEPPKHVPSSRWEHEESEIRDLKNALSRSQELILEHQEKRRQFLLTKSIIATGEKSEVISYTREEIGQRIQSGDGQLRERGGQEDETNLQDRVGVQSDGDQVSRRPWTVEQAMRTREITVYPQGPTERLAEEAVLQTMKAEAQALRGEVSFTQSSSQDFADQQDEFEIVGLSNEVKQSKQKESEHDRHERLPMDIAITMPELSAPDQTDDIDAFVKERQEDKEKTTHGGIFEIPDDKSPVCDLSSNDEDTWEIIDESVIPHFTDGTNDGDFEKPLREQFERDDKNVKQDTINPEMEADFSSMVLSNIDKKEIDLVREFEERQQDFQQETWERVERRMGSAVEESSKLEHEIKLTSQISSEEPKEIVSDPFEGHDISDITKMRLTKEIASKDKSQEAYDEQLLTATDSEQDFKLEISPDYGSDISQSESDIHKYAEFQKIFSNQEQREQVYSDQVCYDSSPTESRPSTIIEETSDVDLKERQDSLGESVIPTQEYYSTTTRKTILDQHETQMTDEFDHTKRTEQQQAVVYDSTKNVFPDLVSPEVLECNIHSVGAGIADIERAIDSLENLKLPEDEVKSREIMRGQDETDEEGKERPKDSEIMKAIDSLENLKVDSGPAQELEEDFTSSKGQTDTEVNTRGTTDFEISRAIDSLENLNVEIRELELKEGDKLPQGQSDMKFTEHDSTEKGDRELIKFEMADLPGTTDSMLDKGLDVSKVKSRDAEEISSVIPEFQVSPKLEKQAPLDVNDTFGESSIISISELDDHIEDVASPEQKDMLADDEVKTTLSNDVPELVNSNQTSVSSESPTVTFSHSPIISITEGDQEKLMMTGDVSRDSIKEDDIGDKKYKTLMDQLVDDRTEGLENSVHVTDIRRQTPYVEIQDHLSAQEFLDVKGSQALVKDVDLEIQQEATCNDDILDKPITKDEPTHVASLDKFHSFVQNKDTTDESLDSSDVILSHSKVIEKQNIEEVNTLLKEESLPSSLGQINDEDTILSVQQSSQHSNVKEHRKQKSRDISHESSPTQLEIKDHEMSIDDQEQGVCDIPYQDDLIMKEVSNAIPEELLKEKSQLGHTDQNLEEVTVSQIHPDIQFSLDLKHMNKMSGDMTGINHPSEIEEKYQEINIDDHEQTTDDILSTDDLMTKEEPHEIQEIMLKEESITSPVHPSSTHLLDTKDIDVSQTSDNIFEKQSTTLDEKDEDRGECGDEISGEIGKSNSYPQQLKLEESELCSEDKEQAATSPDYKLITADQPASEILSDDIKTRIDSIIVSQENVQNVLLSTQGDVMSNIQDDTSKSDTETGGENTNKTIDVTESSVMIDKQDDEKNILKKVEEILEEGTIENFQGTPSSDVKYNAEKQNLQSDHEEIKSCLTEQGEGFSEDKDIISDVAKHTSGQYVQDITLKQEFDDNVVDGHIESKGDGTFIQEMSQLSDRSSGNEDVAVADSRSFNFVQEELQQKIYSLDAPLQEGAMELPVIGVDKEKSSGISQLQGLIEIKGDSVSTDNMQTYQYLSTEHLTENLDAPALPADDITLAKVSDDETQRNEDGEIFASDLVESNVGEPVNTAEKYNIIIVDNKEAKAKDDIQNRDQPKILEEEHKIMAETFEQSTNKDDLKFVNYDIPSDNEKCFDNVIVGSQNAQTTIFPEHGDNHKCSDVQKDESLIPDFAEKLVADIITESQAQLSLEKMAQTAAPENEEEYQDDAIYQIIDSSSEQSVTNEEVPDDILPVNYGVRVEFRNDAHEQPDILSDLDATLHQTSTPADLTDTEITKSMLDERFTKKENVEPISALDSEDIPGDGSGDQKIDDDFWENLRDCSATVLEALKSDAELDYREHGRESPVLIPHESNESKAVSENAAKCQTVSDDDLDKHILGSKDVQKTDENDLIQESSKAFEEEISEGQLKDEAFVKISLHTGGDAHSTKKKKVPTATLR